MYKKHHYRTIINFPAVKGKFPTFSIHKFILCSFVFILNFPYSIQQYRMYGGIFLPCNLCVEKRKNENSISSNNNNKQQENSRSFEHFTLINSVDARLFMTQVVDFSRASFFEENFCEKRENLLLKSFFLF